MHAHQGVTSHHVMFLLFLILEYLVFLILVIYGVD